MSPSASCANWVMPTRTGPPSAPRHPLVLGGVPQILRNHQRVPHRIGAPGPPGAAAPVRTGRACSSFNGACSADTSATSRSSTVTLPPSPRTDATTPPGMFNAVRIVSGSPITVIVIRTRQTSARPPPAHRPARPRSTSRRRSAPTPVPPGDLHRLRPGAPQLLHRVQHPVRPDRLPRRLEPHRQPRPPRRQRARQNAQLVGPLRAPPPAPPAALRPRAQLPLAVLQVARCPAAAASPGRPDQTGSAPGPPAASPPTSDPSRCVLATAPPA